MPWQYWILPEFLCRLNFPSPRNYTGQQVDDVNNVFEWVAIGSGGTVGSPVSSGGLEFQIGFIGFPVFFPVSGGMDATTGESAFQLPSVLAGTYRHAVVRITRNLTKVSTVVVLRKNFISQTLSITIPPLTTGVFRNMTQTITVLLADLFVWQVPSLVDGSLFSNFVGMEFRST